LLDSSRRFSSRSTLTDQQAGIDKIKKGLEKHLKETK